MIQQSQMERWRNAQPLAEQGGGEGMPAPIDIDLKSEYAMVGTGAVDRTREGGGLQGPEVLVSFLKFNPSIIVGHIGLLCFPSINPVHK